LCLTAGEDVKTGTADDDTFNGSVIQGNAETPLQTLNSFDQIDGGEGNDTLNATLNESGPTTPVVDDVETLNIRGVANNAELSLGSVTGAEQVWNARSVAGQTLTFSGVQSTDVTFGVRGTISTTDIVFADAAVAGASDTLNLALENAGNATTAAVVTADDATANGNILEGLDVAVSGDNNVDLTGVGDAVETLTIAGEGTLNAAVDATALTALAAGDFASDLELDLSAATSTELDVVTGAGDDTITVAGSLIAASNTDISIDLGEGENTLGLSGLNAAATFDAVDFTVGTLAGVDALEISNDGSTGITLGAAAELDLAGVDVTDVTFAEGDALTLAANTLSFANTQTELNVAFESAVTATGGGTLELGDAETATLTNAAAVGATYNVTVDGTSGTLNDVTVNAAADAFYAISGDTTNGSISNLSLNDTAETGDTTISVALTNTVDLTSVNLTGGEASDITVDASSAAFDLTAESVTVNIGNIGVDADGITTGGVSYATDATNDTSEVFQFTGDNIGDVTIDDGSGAAGFEAGVGGTADRLDFSQFDSVTELNDLSIGFDGTDTTITAVDGQFDGDITVNGVDLSTDAFNFVF
jgi:hypothetical protein